MYERVMGDQWDTLPESLRALHLPGNAHGRFKIRCASGLPGRLVIFLGRFPHAGDDVPLTLHVEQRDDRLIWRRKFGDSWMTTWQEQKGGHIHEGRGPFYVSFRLVLKDGGFDHVQVAAGVKLGPFCVSFPRWLQPKVSGETRAAGDRVKALVDIHLPLIGFLLSYEGSVWLTPKP